MKTILITGATGFLGSHLLSEILKKRDDFVIVLKRSFSNTDRFNNIDFAGRVKFYDIDKINIERIFEENKIDIIIHCATTYDRQENDVMSIFQSNLFLPLKILQLGILNGVKSFINTDTIMNRNVNQYSKSKKTFLNWLIFFSRDIQAINLSLEQFYGAFDSESKFTSYIFSNLINNSPKIDLTKGEQRRYFVYIDDVVDAFLKVLENVDDISNGYTSFEISSQEAISIKEFVELSKKIIGNNCTYLNFGAIPYRENELMEYKTDISSIMKLGWKPTTELSEGIKKTIEQERAK